MKRTRTKENDEVGLGSLIGIQESMLEEHRRLRYLTAWLLALTVSLLGISILTVAAGL